MSKLLQFNKFLKKKETKRKKWKTKYYRDWNRHQWLAIVGLFYVGEECNNIVRITSLPLH